MTLTELNGLRHLLFTAMTLLAWESFTTSLSTGMGAVTESTPPTRYTSAVQIPCKKEFYIFKLSTLKYAKTVK